MPAEEKRVVRALRLENPSFDGASESLVSRTSSPHSSLSTTTEEDESRSRTVNSDDGGFDSESNASSSGMSELSLVASSNSVGESSKSAFMHSPTSQTVAKIQQRRRMRQKKFLRKGQEGTQAKKDAFRVGSNTGSLTLQSYFHCENKGQDGFSLRHEWCCFLGYLTQLRNSVEEDRLPWKTDFFDWRKMRRPKDAKEALSRLNLNIPYYAANYLEVFYVITFPFLLFYNMPFCVFLLVTCVFVHSIALRSKELHRYDDRATVLGRRVTYHTLGHLMLLSLIVLFLFFNGPKTVALTLLINAAVLIPHALWRRTTFFDDEEMEKCRPKLGQYALTLLFLALCYLEGAADDSGEESTAAESHESKGVNAKGSPQATGRQL